MSVFTPVEHSDLLAFLEQYEHGRLLAFSGIEGGAENTNYRVALDSGEYVLTLVERGASSELPFMVALLEHLYQCGLPVPLVLRQRDGTAIGEMHGLPALLQPFLPGRHVEQPNTHQCHELGVVLARLHQAGMSQLAEAHSNPRSVEWVLQKGRELAPGMEPVDQDLLYALLDEFHSEQNAIGHLPHGVIHGDLFRDNALFDGNHLSGVLDFHNASRGPMLFDVAVCVNDWCSTGSGELDRARTQSLLAGYASLRPFTSAEAAHWPTVLRLTCTRFWLSRLIAAECFAGQNVLIKDPAEYRRMLQARRGSTESLPVML